MNLKAVLAAHQTWLDTNGERGTRADLSGKKLAYTILSGANLARANLADSYLVGAMLEGASMEGASLLRANLAYAQMDHADLSGANLSNAKLVGAELSNAKLVGAILPPLGAQLPEGEFVAWKKVRGHAIFERYAILELVIPASARRTASLVGNKCRADSARVASATTLCGAKYDGDRFFSMFDPRFAYGLGETVTEKRYDGDIRVECTPGIHFFATRDEAVAYDP